MAYSPNDIDRDANFTFLYSPSKTGFNVCTNNPSLLSSETPEPTTQTLPTLYLQILMMMVATGFLQLLLKPLYQQRLTAALIAGILVGPTLLSQNEYFMNQVVPFKSVPVLTMFKNLGIMFYMFLVGLEMNLTPIVRVDGQTIRVAVAGIVVPLALGFCSSYFVLTAENDHYGGRTSDRIKIAFPWAIALTSTNLPNLTKTLSDLKLLRTDIGRTAISSALYNDIVTWLLLLALITFTHEKDDLWKVALSAAAFLLFCAFIARPVLSWMVSQVTVNGIDNDKHIHYVVFGVMSFGLLSDALGLTPIVGAFVFGFILPSGQLTARAADQLGAITNWVSVPLYCLDSGIKTNLHMLLDHNEHNHITPSAFVGFVGMCWMAKVIGCLVATYKDKLEARQAICLAVLMNSKGLLPIFVINFAKDQLKFVGIPESTSMVVVIVVMMITVPVIVKLLYKPPTKQLPHSSRTLSTVTSQWPLRILFGIHSIANVQPIMDLVQISYPTIRSPIDVVVLHLMELTERTSAAAMLIMHNVYGSSRKSAQATALTELQSVMKGMEEYGKIKKEYVSVDCLTTLSPYRTMHEDINSIVDDKYATIVILPFDLKNEVDENDAVNYIGIRNMTHNLLECAPCTVGLFVNRGFGTYASPHPNSSLPRALILFFIGGSDDQEALTFAWRTTSNPQCTLTVVRFIEGDHLSNSTVSDGGHGNRWMFDAEEHARQKIEDDDFMTDFRDSVKDNTRVQYIEEVSNNGEETITIIRDIMAREAYELCIVGRGNGSVSPLVWGLLDLVEYQELGVIADAIVTSHFSDRSSVMVVQRYVENSSCDRAEEPFTKKVWDLYKP